MAKKNDITQWAEIMASLERLKTGGFTPEHLLGAVKSAATKAQMKEAE